MTLTVIESPLFTKLWPDYWSEDARGEFAAYVANNPEAGDVIRGSGRLSQDSLAPDRVREARRCQGHLYSAIG
jgi:hypothetical protein